MKEIKAPSNVLFIGLRVVVNGPEDASMVNSIQDKFGLIPLSIFETNKNLTASASTVNGSGSNTSKSIPVSLDPALIPKTGIKIFDEISKDMVDSPPL